MKYGTAKEQRRVRRLYGLVAGIYDFRVGPFLRGRKHALDALRPNPGDTVLDLACGTGLNFAHIIEWIGPKGRIVGVDFTRPMLNRAQRKVDRHQWDNVTLVEGDATDLPLAAASCDAVLCSYAMAIIPDYRRAIAEAVRVLKPGGRLVLLEPKRGSALWARAVTPLVALSGVGVVHLDRRAWEELPALLKDVSRSEHMGGLVYIASGIKAKTL
jgi:demethylmenaquinone methyltransferase/2-methoxy-6-polyprenyl-1,4-benzoquinol methylase